MARNVEKKVKNVLPNILRVAALLLVFPVSGDIDASSRFNFQARQVDFRPISNWQFLRSQRREMNAQICEYAEKIDDPSTREKHPPCQKLVPIAFNFCSGDIVRAMQPRVISKAEYIHWQRKYSHCVFEATRALVTNPLRKEEYCSAPRIEEELY